MWVTRQLLTSAAALAVLTVAAAAAVSTPDNPAAGCGDVNSTDIDPPANAEPAFTLSGGRGGAGQEGAGQWLKGRGIRAPITAAATTPTKLPLLPPTSTAQASLAPPCSRARHTQLQLP